MKKITRKARNATIFITGILCALLGPFVGWVVNGGKLDYFEHFLRNYPAQAVTYAVIGFGVGIALGALLSTLDYINQRDKDEESKANGS